jgi:hypothetical protein
MPQRAWDSSVVHSYSKLKNYFIESYAINQVVSKKHKRTTRTLNPLNPNLAFKWRVCNIATFPLRLPLLIILVLISKISSLAGKNKVRTYTRDGARFLYRGFNTYSQEPTKIFRLHWAQNGPDKRGDIVNNTPFIPMSQIPDEKVHNRTFCSIYRGVKFNHQNGICRGMCDWFMYLYLNTKEQFSDPRSHMCMLGKQFKNGGGQEPTFLQSINIKKGKLLGLKVGTQNVGSPSKCLHKWATVEWNSRKSEMVQQLQNIPPGVYSTWVPRHATAYIKIHDSLGFFFDPNHGITEINGPSQGEQLYTLISTALSNTGESKTASHNFITITPVTRR